MTGFLIDFYSEQAMPDTTPHIALFLGSFGGGGIERITAHLAHGFVKLGVRVDLVLNRGESPHWVFAAGAANSDVSR